MKQRIAALLRTRPQGPEDGDNLLFDSGDTVPADGATGYQTGCIFQHTDGGEGTAFYVNEGTSASADFNVVASITAAQEALLSATAGTAAASKALIADASIDIAGLNDVGVDGTLTAAIANIANLIFATAARTATSDGLTTGTIADSGMLNFITVTSASANNIIVLPSPTPGTIVILFGGANGYELRTSAPATIAINGGSGASAESAIPANTTAVLICESATTWKGFQMAVAGTLTLVEVAA
jgi:uncharacterized protein YjlB